MVFALIIGHLPILVPGAGEAGTDQRSMVGGAPEAAGRKVAHSEKVEIGRTVPKPPKPFEGGDFRLVQGGCPMPR